MPRIAFGFDPPFLDGGVNGRKPSFELPRAAGIDPPLFPGAEFTRACRGDMAGA